MNIQVATATEEQSSVVGEINRNVEDINQLTMETADIAHQLTGVQPQPATALRRARQAGRQPVIR